MSEEREEEVEEEQTNEDDLPDNLTKLGRNRQFNKIYFKFQFSRMRSQMKEKQVVKF